MKKILIFSLLLFTATAYAQNITFMPFGKGISKKDSLKIERVIQYQSAFYSQFGTVADTAKAKLIVFNDKRALHNYLKFREVKNSLGNHTIGTFLKDRRELLVARTDKTDLIQGVSWQISNYFIFLTFGDFKDSTGHWLQSGLDGYFKNITVKKDTILHEKPTKHSLARVKTAIQTGELDLKEFMGFSKKEIYKSQKTNEGYAYSLSHCIVYFLATQNLERFKQMLRKIGDYETSYEAIDAIYPGGFSQFEPDFIAYYK